MNHFYTEDGMYTEESKNDIDKISKEISDFYLPLYDKYRKLGYPAIEICQVIEDQIEFGLLRYRMETAARHAKEEAEKKETE